MAILVLIEIQRLSHNISTASRWCRLRSFNIVLSLNLCVINLVAHGSWRINIEDSAFPIYRCIQKRNTTQSVQNATILVQANARSILGMCRERTFFIYCIQMNKILFIVFFEIRVGVLKLFILLLFIHFIIWFFFYVIITKIMIRKVLWVFNLRYNIPTVNG